MGHGSRNAGRFEPPRPQRPATRQQYDAALLRFDTEDEAVAIANDTAYGLTDYVQTQDLERARRVARRLRSGMVEMNGQFLGSGTPFGGFGHSGNGSEGGVWGLEEFLEVKAVSGWTPVEA